MVGLIRKICNSQNNWIKTQISIQTRKLRVKVLALELGLGIGEIVYWYESLSNGRGYSTKVKDISIKKYKEILWDKIEDSLATLDMKLIILNWS